MAAGFLHHRLVQVVLPDLDIIQPADFGQKQAQAHTPFRNGPEFGLVFLVAAFQVFRVQALAARLFLFFEVPPDSVKFLLHQPRRNIEVNQVGKLVKQVSLEPHA